MTFERGLSDMLVFEIPDLHAAEHLSARLQSRWTEWIQEQDGRWLLVVLLRPVQGDLAVLLREVEAWCAFQGLDELWFHLDRRSYLIKAERAAAVA